MKKERLQEIKDSIDLQLTVAKSVGTTNELAEEEKELYDEVVRLNNVINETKEKLIRLQEKYDYVLDDVIFSLERKDL